MEDLILKNTSLKTRLNRQLTINKLQSKQIKNIERRYQDLINKTRKNSYGIQ